MDDVSFLDILPNLTYLDLHCGEDLTDISAIRYCTELSELILVGAVSLEDPTPIAALQQLDYLTIAECGLTDVSWMTTLQNLSSLDIRNNRITDLSPLSELANLQELHMSGNLVTNYGTIDRSIIVIDD